MDVATSDHILDNYSQGCFLTVTTPREHTSNMKHCLYPLIEWIDPAYSIVRIKDSKDLMSFPEDRHQTSCDNAGLGVPSIAVMLFLSENGDFSYRRTRHFLRFKPWRLHHSIELSHKWSQSQAGRQDFYTMFAGYPLWSVNAAYARPEVLRFTIFVKNFMSMVEFYRLVTETEMESQKPGFCIFPLYHQPGLQIELCLKQQNNLNPHPILTTYLTFSVHNMKALKAVLGVTVLEIEHHKYSAVDPEGNRIVLHDISPGFRDRLPVSCAQSVHFNTCMSHSKHLNSLPDSRDGDSGRFSDSDICDSEAASVVNLKYKLEKHLCDEFTDCLVYPDTNYALFDTLCENCRMKISHDVCVNTSNSTFKCSKRKDNVLSCEGYTCIDKAFQSKTPSLAMEHSSKSPLLSWAECRTPRRHSSKLVKIGHRH